jgi:hypothetical protein
LDKIGRLIATMMTIRPLATLVCVTFLAGCSAGNLLNSKSTVPQAGNIPVGNQLALPPDLALQAPTDTVDGYQPNGRVASLDGPALDSGDGGLDATQAPAPVARPPTDIYARYNINTKFPDGKPKDPVTLRNELKKAITAEKRKANPGYGTIWNIGSIFTDG